MRRLSPIALVMIAGVALSAPAAGGATAPKIIGSPLATIGRYPDSGRPFFYSYVRLTRPVPRKSNGVLLGAMRLNGLGAKEAPSRTTFSSFGFTSIATRGRRYCYEQGFGSFGYDQYPPSLRRAKIGDLVRVEVLVAGTAKPLVGRTRLRPRLELTEEVAARRLGCLGPRKKRDP